LESLMMTNLGLQYTKMILSENFTWWTESV
jgi:hypothetical protein